MDNIIPQQIEIEVRTTELNTGNKLNTGDDEIDVRSDNFKTLPDDEDGGIGVSQKMPGRIGGGMDISKTICKGINGENHVSETIIQGTNGRENMIQIMPQEIDEEMDVGWTIPKAIDGKMGISEGIPQEKNGGMEVGQAILKEIGREIHVFDTIPKEIDGETQVPQTIATELDGEILFSQTIPKKIDREIQFSQTIPKEFDREIQFSQTIPKEFDREIQFSQTIPKEIVRGVNFNETIPKQLDQGRCVSETTDVDTNHDRYDFGVKNQNASGMIRRHISEPNTNVYVIDTSTKSNQSTESYLTTSYMTDIIINNADNLTNDAGESDNYYTEIGGDDALYVNNMREMLGAVRTNSYENMSSYSGTYESLHLYDDTSYSKLTTNKKLIGGLMLGFILLVVIMAATLGSLLKKDALQCDEAPDVYNGHVERSGSNINDVTVYTCLDGYIISNSSVPALTANSTCQLNEYTQVAEWKDVPRCQAVLCGSVPEINNGTAVTQGLNIGDLTKYTCSRDYRINGSSSLGMSANSSCLMSADNMTAFWSDVPSCAETVSLLVSLDAAAMIYSLAIFPERQILAILDNDFGKLLRLYDGEMNSLQLPFDTSDVGEPVEIAVKYTGNTAVAIGDLSDRSIHIFIQLNDSVWIKYKFHVEFKPFYLTFTNEGDILLASGSDKVLKYTVTGEKLWDKYVPRQPDLVTTNSMGQIIVSRIEDVTVYTKDLDWLFSFPFKADRNNLHSIIAVVTDTEDNILVVDEDKEAVLLFSPEGHYIRRLFTAEGDIIVIALYEDILVVGSWQSTTIYVYSYA